MSEHHVTDDPWPIPRWLQMQAPRSYHGTSELPEPCAMPSTRRSLSVGARPSSNFCRPRAESTIGSLSASRTHEDPNENTFENLTSVADMPPEITAEIIRYLDTPDVFALRAASSYFRDHVDARSEHYLNEYVCSLDTQHLNKLLGIVQDAKMARLIKSIIFSAGGSTQCHNNTPYFDLIEDILHALASTGTSVMLGVRRSHTKNNFESQDRKAADNVVRFLKRLLRNTRTTNELNLKGFTFDLGWKRRSMQTAPDCGCYEPLTEWAWTLASSSNLPVIIRVYDWHERPDIVPRVHGQLLYDPVNCCVDIQSLCFRHWRIIMPFIRKLDNLRALSISSTEVGFEPLQHLLMDQPLPQVRLSSVIMPEQAYKTMFIAGDHSKNWKVCLVKLEDDHRGQLELCKLSSST